MSRTLTLAAAALIGFCTALPAAAQFQRPDDAVKYRKAGFTMIGAHFGRIGAMVQGRVPYDAAAAQANAEVLAQLSVLPFAGFVEGTAGTAKGEPKGNVWTERAKFDAAAKKMQDEVAKLVVAARAGSMDQLRPAAGAVQAACKGCHDDFRNP